MDAVSRHEERRPGTKPTAACGGEGWRADPCGNAGDAGMSGRASPNVREPRRKGAGEASATRSNQGVGGFGLGVNGVQEGPQLSNQHDLADTTGHSGLSSGSAERLSPCIAGGGPHARCDAGLAQRLPGYV